MFARACQLLKKINKQIHLNNKCRLVIPKVDEKRRGRNTSATDRREKINERKNGNEGNEEGWKKIEIRGSGGKWGR